MNTINEGLSIYAGLKFIGFTDELSKFAAAQSAHETNGYTSKLLKDNNNAFGMKYAHQSLAKGSKNGYAYYDSLKDSINDFVKWWIHAKSITIFPLFVNSLENYVKVLKKNNYFEDTEANYLKGCQNFYKLLFG
jgi:flagellum-specific peptidoglycan hydrolase FlgJ